MFALHVLAVFAALSGRVTAQDATAKTSVGQPFFITASPTASAKVSATASSTSGPATIQVAVGGQRHAFDPKEITANVGDIIKFNFYPGGHRVIRAEFGFPCVPYEYATVNKVGFDTGFFDPQVLSSDPPNYLLRVNSTEPIFFYCGAPGSCVDYKMIGVINANKTQTFADQLKVAETVTYQLLPGEPFPTETASTPGSTGGSTGGSNSSGGSSSLGAGAIAGIAIGAAAVLIIAAALLYLCGRRGGFDKAYRKSGLAFGRGEGGGGEAGAASPPMVEAKYANAAATNLKSPGQASLSTFAGHDNGTFHHSSHGQPPYYGLAPSPGPQLPVYGLAPGQGAYDPHYSSPHSSPVPNHYPAQFTPPPVELPSQDVPLPAQSPPPGYAQDHGSWAPGQEGLYQPGGKP